MGGLVGAAVSHAGSKVLITGGLYKIGIFIILAPVLGLVIGLILMMIVHRLFWDMSFYKGSRLFRVMQLFLAAAYSLGYSGNDAQKTMGIILMTLIAGGLP